jgi:tRNA(adenine34) deaminase
MFEKYTKILINLAKKASSEGEVPISAIAVQNGEIIAKAHNKTEKNQDKTAHAEMLLIRKLQKKFGHSNFINEKISIYTSLQPCCMCMAAISSCGFIAVFYLLEEQKFGGQRIFLNNSAYKKVEMWHIESEEYEEILKGFFQKLR